MSTPDPTDPLDIRPLSHISARRLHELAKDDAIFLPLTNPFGSVDAYRVDAYLGPYLMTVEEKTRYVEKCRRETPIPTLTPSA